MKGYPDLILHVDSRSGGQDGSDARGSGGTRRSAAANGRGVAGVRQSGAPGVRSGCGLAEEPPHSMRNALAATGRRFGAPGVMLVGDGGSAWRRVGVLGSRACYKAYKLAQTD